MGKITKIKKERAEETRKGRAEESKREAILPLQALLREDYLTAIVISTLTFVVYAFTAAPGVTLADSGDFLMGVLTLGIVHPPGYPLYTVLGHLFSLLPFGDPAFRVNLFSALWGSLCLGVVFLILRILSIERIHTVFATLFLGFTTVFWSKTGVAEVYSFNAFLIACIFFWILAYNRDKKRSQLYLIFLTTGLALSNHYPLVILTLAGLVFLLDRRDLHAGAFFKGLLFLGLGLTPYLYLFIQASPDLEYNLAKSFDSSMVLDHILMTYNRKEFGGTIADKLPLAFTYLKATITNFLFGTILLISGVTWSLMTKWKYRYPLLIAALSPSLGLLLILTFPSDEHKEALLIDYLIPTFLFFTVFLALGLKEHMNRYVTNHVLKLSMLLILFLTQVGFHFPTSNHHNDRLAEVWGTQILNSLEPSSILIICGPPGEMLSLYYLSLIKGLRPDLTLSDSWSTITKDNLYGPGLLLKRKDALEYRRMRQQQLINNSVRPVYYLCKSDLDELGVSFVPTPFVYRVDKRPLQETNAAKFRLSDRLLQSLVQGYPKSEFWLDKLRGIIFLRLISYYGGHNLPEVNRILHYFRESEFYSDPGVILPLANNVYYLGNHDLARAFYERAGELSLEAFSATDLAVFCSLLASEGNYAKALPICIDQEQSSAPCEVNTIATRQTIARIYKHQANWPKVAEYSRKILQCQPDYKIAQSYLRMATERGN